MANETNDTLTASPEAVAARDKLAKERRLGWRIALPFRARVERPAKRNAGNPSVAPGAPDGAYPEKAAKPKAPSSSEVVAAADPGDRIGFAYGLEPEPGESREAYWARLEKFRTEHPDELIGADFVDALAQGVQELWEGTDRARAAAMRLRQQANPKSPAPKDTNSVGAPTALRESKEAGWQIVDLPGGQRRYQARTVMADLAKHFTEDELAAGIRLCQDGEIATRVNLINSRTYDGMPAGGGSAGKAGHISDGQRRAHARFNYVMKNLEEPLRPACAALVLGVRNERMGKPMTGAEFGALASKYSGEKYQIAFTAGFLKCLLIRIDGLQREFAAAERRRLREIEALRSQRSKEEADRKLAAQAGPRLSVSPLPATPVEV